MYRVLLIRIGAEYVQNAKLDSLELPAVFTLASLVSTAK